MTADTQLTTCFGFAVRSPLSFSYLRAGTGDVLEIAEHSGDGRDPGEELIREWLPIPGRRFHARLYGSGGRYRLWIAGAGWFVIDPSVPRIELPVGENPVRREERLWGIPALLSFLHRGDLPLHAAAVEVDGGAVILAAPSYFGKTTLAAAFYAAGHRVLAEDLCCIRLSPSPSIVPGPAMVRLRPDVADRLDLRGVRVLARDADRLHLSLAPEHRGDCRPVPVRAIVLLHPSDGSPTLERISPGDALRDLWPLSFRLAGEDDVSRSFAGLADLAGRAPVWNLHRTLVLEELPTTVDAIAAGV